MEKNTIRIISFIGQKQKWHMWSVKFAAGAGIKECYILLTGAKRIPDDEENETKAKKFY